MFPDLRKNVFIHRGIDMAGDYALPEKAMTAAPRRFEKFLKAFIFLALFALGGQLIWLMGVSPFRPFSRIDILGNGELDRTEILAMAGINGDSSYFSTDERAVEKTLMGLYTIQSAKVFKHFPDRLQIILEGRQAVASALVYQGDRTVPVFFDSQGVVFKIGRDKRDELHQPDLHQQDLLALPIISGLIIEEPFPGMRLPAAFLSLFRELEKIQSSAPELLTAVSELRINPKSYEGFDLVLYPVHKKVKVRLSELNEDLLRYTLLLVDVLAAKEGGQGSLDFRGGIASYIPKEASSE